MDKKMLEIKNMHIRINKYLADNGIASRRAIDKLISDGRITVNGVVLVKPGYIVKDEDVILFDGKKIKIGLKKNVYILFNKPTGCITTNTDTHGRKTVLDYIGCGARVFPIGRLDKDTTGVLLLTNDGDLAHKLMHPKYSVEKIYQAYLDKPLTSEHKKRFESGIMLDAKKTTPCVVKYVDSAKRDVVVTLHEGRNRQIHRMFNILGYKVERLDRTCYAGLGFGSVKRGEWRNLTDKEINKLF